MLWVEWMGKVDGKMYCVGGIVRKDVVCMSDAEKDSLI